MTVSNLFTDNVLTSGNGITVAFTTRFLFSDNTEVLVYLKDSVTGVETLQTISTHYTLTGAGTGSAGTVTFLTPPTVTEQVKIVRATAMTQATDYVEGTKFPATSHENALDKLTRIAQEIDTKIGRSPQLPVSSVNYPSEFPDWSASTASYVFRVNAAGTALELVSPMDAGLSATLTPTDGGFVVGDGSDFVVETGSTARDSLGLGTMATQTASGVSITGGTITGITDLTVADGGTGASDAAGARTNLGLGTLATQSGTFSGTSSGTNTGDQNVFTTIAVSGQSNVVSDAASDTLTLVAGTNITITTDAGTDSITINSSAGGGGAPTTSQYVTLATDGTLTNERVLTGTANQVILTDGGAGSTLTLSLPQSIATSSGPQFATIELGAASDTTLSRSSAGNVAIEGNVVYRAGGTDVPVTDGGTGVSTLTTAYGVLCAGTTATGAVQTLGALGASGTVLTSNGAGALPSFQAAGSAAAGQVIQVVSTAKTDSFTTTSTTAVDITGMSVSITPASASNKVLVIVSVSCAGNGTNSNFINLLRGSTQIFMGDTSGAKLRNSWFSRASATNEATNVSFVYLDSPATTSSTTYKLQGLIESGLLTINRSGSDADNSAYGRTASSITVMEVKG